MPGATVAAMRDRGLIAGDRLTLETGAGIVPVVLEGDQIVMQQVAPTFGPRPDPALVAAAISRPVAEIVGQPQLVSTGLPFCITVLEDHAVLKAARLDATAMQALGAALGADGSDVMEPFLVTLEGATAGGDTFSRLLMLPPSPPEDLRQEVSWLIRTAEAEDPEATLAGLRKLVPTFRNGDSQDAPPAPEALSNEDSDPALIH